MRGFKKKIFSLKYYIVSEENINFIHTAKMDYWKAIALECKTFIYTSNNEVMHIF